MLFPPVCEHYIRNLGSVVYSLIHIVAEKERKKNEREKSAVRSEESEKEMMTLTAGCIIGYIT